MAPEKLRSLTRDRATVELWHRAGVWRHRTLGDLLAIHAHARPDAVALVDARQRLTFAEYRRRVVALARALVELGVEPDDRVAILLPNWAEFPIARLACSEAGAVSVILNTGHGEREVAAALRTTRAAALIVAAAQGGRSNEALIGRLRASCPELRSVILAGPGLREQEHSLDGIFARAGPVADDQVGRRHGPDEIDDVIFTSGTTGRPRGVLSCQNRWLASCENQRRAGGFGPDDVGLVLAPAGGTIGYLKSTVLALLAGGAVVLVENSDPLEIVRTLERERATYVAAVPAQTARFVAAIRAEREAGRPPDLSPLRLLFNGGAPLARELARDVRALTGCFLLTAIGSSEAGVVAGTQLGDPEEVQVGTVGAAYPGCLVEVRDPAGRTLAAGEVGELVSWGATMFDGYLNDPEATIAALTPDGWVRHGDLASVDEHGYVSFLGRIDDVINRGGLKVSPLEVEELLARHPAVREVAVAGVPDVVLGQRVWAFVVLREGGVLDVDECGRFLDALGVARSKRPEHVVTLSELPLSAGGKVDRRALVASVTT